MNKIPFYIIVSFFLGLISCDDQFKSANKNNSKKLVMDTMLIPPSIINDTTLKDAQHPLANKVNTFLDNQELVSFDPTGFTKLDYLKIIDLQTNAMLKYQDVDGRIIDPVEKEEKFYTTPCFAHSVAALVDAGFIENNSALAIRGIKALDVSLVDMVNATVNGNHGDFYTWPVMLAYRLFKPHVSEEKLKFWDEKLNSIPIEKLYRTYDKPEENNWVLVHTAGEFLRAQNGFTDTAYVEKMLGIQLNNFTELGMYNEYGNPLPYDLFPRHYLSGMLELGYNGKHALALRDGLWRGAWSSLFIQSPFGELPTGYRSSHHIWNEAEQCVLFEIYASAYAKNNRMKEAGAFKRAAMLSLGSIKKWIRGDGSGYIVKNRYPIENRHGYENYSMHTCYNMLATSMLAQAWEFSNSKINEFPAPADIGGFVIPILEPFHKAFANAAGTYLEYETEGDGKYNPTGIVRVHLKEGNPQLGPSNGLAPFFSGEGVYLALGPSWQKTDGTWISLAEQKGGIPRIEIVKESMDSVIFKIEYQIKNTSGKGKISELITIANGSVIIEDTFEGITGKKRITWPMLVFDGETNTIIELSKQEATVSLNGKGVHFKVMNNQNIVLERAGEKIKYVNGLAETVFAEFDKNKITYSLLPN